MRYASLGFSGACASAFSRLRLRRQLSPFISRMWTWWVSRSSSTLVSRSEPKTSVHSSKGRLVVTRMEPRSHTPLAGIPEVWLSSSGVATGFASHPFSYGEWEFPAMAVNRAVSSHLDRVRPGPSRCQWRRRPVTSVKNGYHEFRAHADSADVVPVQ